MHLNTPIVFSSAKAGERDGRLRKRKGYSRGSAENLWEM